MNTLSELISRRYTPEAKIRKKPTIQTLTTRLQATREGEDYQYEVDVFNYFLDNSDSLGIKSIMKFTALLVDGAVDLLDGTRLTVEIKYRMNWHKACQAESQFRNCLKRHHTVVGAVAGGLVLFEEFSGDWKRVPATRLLENGWNHWYISHSEVDGLRLDLLRLCGGKLESCPSVKAVHI